MWHALTRSYRMYELAQALVEIGAIDQAIAIAERGTRLETSRHAELVAAARAPRDPASVIPVLRRLIAADLTVADARNYESAVKRLKLLRSALDASGRSDEFALFVAALRDEYRRRPRFLAELARARL